MMGNYCEYNATFHGVEFAIRQWDYPNNESDVELSAMVQSPDLYYPGSTLVPIGILATVRTSHAMLDLFPYVEKELDAYGVRPLHYA
jgi:hypothetical protein